MPARCPLRARRAAAAVAPASNRMFKSWMSEHSKVYGGAEQDYRFRIFKTNTDFILAHNNDASQTFRVGHNQFSDMASEEFKSTMMGLKKNPNFGVGNPTMVQTGVKDDSVDWRAKGAVTPVKNQGQCGSCWAFSTTGSTEGANQIATQTLTSVSEQQLVDCSRAEGNMGCNGGLMDNGFKYIEKQPLCTEESYPYTAKDGTCDISTCKTGTTVGVSGYQDVPSKNEAALAEAVSKGPVSIAIEADQQAFQLYKSGVFSKACGTQLDHGVLIVGYGAEDSQNYWIVKNSWGATWGDSGYIMMAKDVSDKSGTCGLAMQPSYPTVGGAKRN
jgi:C1A family cysteine protease